jgi:DNA-binding transcriptional ArsR family regulator
MRIHFTRLDLARTYLADGPDPMWELVNSLQALQTRYGEGVLGGWRRRAAPALHRAGLAAAVRHRLFPLAPHAPYFPDLLTPPEGALGIDAGVEAVLSTPRARLHGEIGRLNGGRAGGAWLADLSAGRARALSELGNTMREYDRCAIAPEWNSLRAIVDADLAVRRSALSMGGVEAMLSSFHSGMRWRYPVLELPGHPSAREVHLRGRGLTLVASFFCRLHPMTVYDEHLPQVLVYPVHHEIVHDGPTGDAAVLGRLLGETRAAVLLAARGGGTTSALAARVGVSAAAISHHTAILRDAGLITSIRSANTVRHSLTRLGQALVERHPSYGPDAPTDRP